VGVGVAQRGGGRGVGVAALAAEAVQRAGDAGQPAAAALAHALHALLAALQGDGGTSRDHAQAAMAMCDCRLVVGVATWALGLVALGGGRFQDAHDLLRQIFAMGNPAEHRRVAMWAIADLVEAAVRSGQADGLEALVEDLGRRAETTASVRAVLVTRRAKALLAAEGEADDLFRAALAT